MQEERSPVGFSGVTAFFGAAIPGKVGVCSVNYRRRVVAAESLGGGKKRAILGRQQTITAPALAIKQLIRFWQPAPGRGPNYLSYPAVSAGQAQAPMECRQATHIMLHPALGLAGRNKHWRKAEGN